MQNVLIVIHLIIVVALVGVVLLQRSEGGGLGMGSGGGGGVGGFMTGRGQANALTRATAILATIFFLTSIALTVLASMNHKQKSIFDGSQPGAAAPAGANAPPALPEGKGGLLNELQKMQDQKPPAAPASPIAPPAPTGPQVPKSQ